MTNQEMLNAYNGLKLFQEKEAQIYKEDGKKILSGKIKLSYAINKNTNLLLNALKPYEDTRKELMEEYRDLEHVVLIQQIEKAYRKGIYKQYCTFEGNDSKVRGKIDIARHIRLNPLFNGKIAYSYREYTINNNTNRLILTAYTLMEKKYKGIMTQLVKNKTNVSVFIKNLKNVTFHFLLILL